MATISFYSDTEGVENLLGSGLGFYGAGFGRSVAVGEYQQTTFITDGNGTVEGAQVDNIKWIHPNSGQVNGGGDILLTHIPNRLSTLNPRFTHDSAVQVQNVELRIYDRVDVNNPPSGVTCKVAELIHPNPTNGAGGSGDTSWITPQGSAVVVDLAPSPGISGLFAGNGSNSTAPGTEHSWYVALSASPDSIGSKTLFGLSLSLEYL
jgi:hypothetical protein